MKVYASIMNYLGKSVATGDYLNDTPPFRAISGVKLFKGNYWIELETIYQHKHTHVGPAEIKIPSYTVLNLVASLNVRNDLAINFQIYNLFDKLYLGRPDPDSVYEPGCSVSVGIRYEF